MSYEGVGAGSIARGQAFRSANGRDKPMTAGGVVGVAAGVPRLQSPAGIIRQHSKTELENLQPHNRRTDVISGLRNQLLNIKSEVSKLLTDTPHSRSKMFSSQSPESRVQVNLEVMEGFRDSAERRPRELPKPGLNTRPLQLQNESLREQLRSVKRRYMQKKQQHKEQTLLLKKKIHALQQLLTDNQSLLVEYKSQYEGEMQAIRKQLQNLHSSQAHEAELARVRTQANEYRNIIKDLEEEMKKVKEEYAGKLLEYKEEVGREGGKEEIERLRRELQEVSQNRERVGKEYTEKYQKEMQNQKNQYEQQLQNLTTQFHQKLEQSSQQAKNKLQSKVNDYIIQQSKLKNEIQHLLQIAFKKDKQIQKLKFNLNKFEQEKSNKVNEQSQQTTELREEVNSLSRQLNLCNQNLRKLREEKDNLQIKLTQLLGKNAQLDQICSNLEKTTKTLKCQRQITEVNEQEKLKQAISTLDAQKHNIEKKLAQQNKQLEMSKSQLATKHRQLKEISLLYDSARQSLMQRDSQIENIQEEWSLKYEQQQLLCVQLQNKLYNQEAESNETIGRLKRDLTFLRSKPTANSTSDSKFDDALREQIEQIRQLKMELSTKEDQIFQLRDHITCNRSQVENIKADLQIEKLKAIAERKNMQVGFEVQLQKLKNQLDVQKKAADSASHKLKIALDEVKSKDEFIQRCIMGKKLTSEQKSHATEFFKEYQTAFPTGVLKNKLQAEAKEIQRLQRVNIDLLLQLSSFKSKTPTPSSCQTLTTESSEAEEHQIQN